MARPFREGLMIDDPPPARLRRLPGDLPRDQQIARMIRVDHAGEYGAVRIYDGQLAVLGRGPAARAIRAMAVKEKAHLETFDKLVVDRHVRPTLLSPIWHVAGFALGAASALLGPRAAMACTVAVEEVIDEHYKGQLDQLDESDGDLKKTVAEFRQDELAHRDEALARGARQAPAYEALSAAVKTGSRLAIWLSERF